MPYQTPGGDVVSIIDAPPTPLASLAPGGHFIALVHYEPHRPVGAPDGRRFAFTVDEPDGIGVWVADAEAGTAAAVPGLRVSDVLGGEPSAGGGAVRWSRDGRSLLALALPPEPAPVPAAPVEPQA